MMSSGPLSFGTRDHTRSLNPKSVKFRKKERPEDLELRPSLGSVRHILSLNPKHRSTASQAQECGAPKPYFTPTLSPNETLKPCIEA